MMESPTLELFIIIKSLALFWGRGMERRNFTGIMVKWWNKHAWSPGPGQNGEIKLIFKPSVLLGIPVPKALAGKGPLT